MTEPIGTRRQLMAFPGVYSETPIYGIRPLPAEVRNWTPGREVVQAQVPFLGEMVWVNEDAADITINT